MSGSVTKQSQEETILALLAANHSLQREIAALRAERDALRKLMNEPGTVKFPVEEFDAQIRRAEERGEEKGAAEVAALREAVRWTFELFDGKIWIRLDLDDDTPLEESDCQAEISAIRRALEEER